MDQYIEKYKEQLLALNEMKKEAPHDYDHHDKEKPEDCHCHDNLDKMPLAMAYVPWQRWGKVYEPDVALERGTLFPDLDLPWLGEEVQ